MSNNRLPLQEKVSSTLMVLIALFILVTWIVLDSVIAPAFDDLEVADAEVDLKRTRSAIATDLANLAAVTADWSPWDDIYDYVSGQNPGFEKSNLNRPTLENLGLDLMTIYSRDEDRRRCDCITLISRSHSHDLPRTSCQWSRSPSHRRSQ